MGEPTSSAGVGFTLAALLGASVFGIGMGEFLAAATIAFIGVVARSGVEIRLAVDGKGDWRAIVRIGAGNTGTGLMLCPFISVVSIALAHKANYPLDGMFVITVALLGYAGIQGVNYLVSRARGIIPIPSGPKG